MIGYFSIKASGSGTCFVYREFFFKCCLLKIFACRGHFQELQIKSDLADFSKIWPDARKIYNQQKHVGEFDNS